MKNVNADIAHHVFFFFQLTLILPHLCTVIEALIHILTKNQFVLEFQQKFIGIAFYLEFDA